MNAKWNIIFGCAGVFLAACGAFADTWTQEAKLLASDGAAGDQFGQAVAICGTTALVGAFTDDHGSSTNWGSVYVYDNGPCGWTQTTKIVPSNGMSLGSFGYSVALSGDTAVIGGYAEDFYRGATYFYRRDGSSWAQVAKFSVGYASAYDELGVGVAIDGQLAIAGAHYMQGVTSYAGSALIFRDAGPGWACVGRLVASDGASHDRFGQSVSISGSTAIVGAYGNDQRGAEAGAAYVFNISDTGWTQIAKLTASDAAAGDIFGCRVDIDGTTAIVGASGGDGPMADSGAAYIFRETESGWEQVAKLTADDGDWDDRFGCYVSVRGSTALVGAMGDDDRGDYAGAVYAFRDTGAGWTQVAKFTGVDTAAGDWFGYGLDYDGQSAIIGAFGDTAFGADSGSAYIVTPEPASLALLALAGAAMAMKRRGRRA